MKPFPIRISNIIRN